MQRQVGLLGLIRKRGVVLLLVILIIILIAETAVLMIIVLQSFSGGRQVFPGLSAFRTVAPGCPTLVWSVESTTNSNRSVVFTCPIVSGNQRDALVLTGFTPGFSGSFEGKNPYSPVFVVVPSFTLPLGYLRLSLTTISCLVGTRTPLKTGQEIGVGLYSSSYNYCAVIDSSVSKVDSFTIDWSDGALPIVRPAPFTMSVSPTTETTPAGGTANYTATLASLGGWTGNVTVALRGGYTLGIPYYVSPPSLILKPGGSNVTTLRLPTCTPNGTYCASPGKNLVIVEAYTGCLVGIPNGPCVDSYQDVNISVNVVIV